MFLYHNKILFLRKSLKPSLYVKMNKSFHHLRVDKTPTYLKNLSSVSFQQLHQYELPSESWVGTTTFNLLLNEIL